MKRLLFIFSFFFLFVLNGKTQEVEILTLEDCLRIGIDNNLSLEGKRKEIQKSKYGVSENRSKLLPQINAIAGYNNNFDPPVSVTDGSSYGVPYNITKTLQHSANAGLEMQMPLFNQTLYTSMSIAKVMEEISRLSYGKAREDVILQISKMYYLGQVTAEQIMLIKANITRLEELRDITQAFFDNGMSMEVDLKRVNINLENLQVQLAERQKKIITNGYIPSLSLTGSWRYAAYTDKGYHWFHSGPSNQWFRSYGVGLTLRIPIFDGLDKTYKIKKAMIDIENKRLAWEDARKNLQTQYLNAVNDLMNNQRNFKKQKDNYLLAEDVYAVTSDRYREGIASMTEVLQDEMQMSEAQNNYISAHYNYRVTNLMLLKLTGQIESLVK